MEKNKVLRKTDRMQQIFDHSERTKIRASEVGITLKISDKALAELERIEYESAKAMQDASKYLWR